MEMLLKTASERNKEQKSARGRGGDCFLFIIRSVSSNEGRRTMSPVHSGALIPAYAAHARLPPGRKSGFGKVGPANRQENWSRHKGHDTAARKYDGKVSLFARRKSFQLRGQFDAEIITHGEDAPNTSGTQFDPCLIKSIK